MIRKVLPILLLFLIGLPACGFAGNDLPGKIAFRSNRFPAEKEPMSNTGVTIYRNGRLYDKFHHLLSPRWSPDGKRLLGGSGERQAPPKSVVVVDYDMGKFNYVDIEHFSAKEAWFPDGRKIVYAGYGGWEGARRIAPDNIYTFDLEKRKVIKQLTHFTDPDPEISVDGLDVSSDAKLVIFSRYDSNKTKSTMTVIDLETGDIKDLPGEGGGPRFIRGTHKIVYAEAVPDARVNVPSKKNFAVMLHDLDTGDTRRITNDSRYVGIKHPAPSPDGKWICYVHDTLTGYEGKSVRVIKIAGTDERILASGDDYASLDWGP